MDAGTCIDDLCRYYQSNKRDSDVMSTFIVKFNGIFIASTILERHSIKPSFYVPHDAYVVSCTGAIAEELRQTAGLCTYSRFLMVIGVSWVGHYDAKYKISSSIDNRKFEIHSSIPRGLAKRGGMLCGCARVC